ncbi:MAG: Lrp/AsnC family transcriptional regulator [Thiobacillus sp.]|nr:Lrp/AsnC family transcriptional regulator [Thiobacillus sp.]
MSDLEFRLLNDWQRGFPLVPRPYAELAKCLDCDETTVLDRLASLKQRGHVSRVGAVFRPHVLGWSTLAAVACPPERLEEVARAIDCFPEVNHNYEREHAYNLWFVAAAPGRERVDEVLAEIHRATGLKPLDLPMVADYHIDLGFELGGRPAGRGPHQDAAGSPVDTAVLRGQLESADYTVATVLENGLELISRPYASLAARCGMGEVAFMARLERLLALSVIRRFGVVVRHRELGYTANAMVVWDIPDARVAEAGRLLAAQAGVTLCYQRPRRLPDWPYNLFSMVHGKDRAAVLDQVDQLREHLRHTLDLEDVRCQPLFSRRRFKQCGARYSSLPKAA